MRCAGLIDLVKEENPMKHVLSIMIASTLILAGCSGETSYEEKSDPLEGRSTAQTVTRTDGKPLNVAVMPLSISVQADRMDKATVQKAKDPVFQKKLWSMLKSGVNASPAFNLVALPKSAEGDEIIKKTMSYAAGLLPASEFKKITSFKMPEKFLYGAVSVQAMVEEGVRNDKKSFVASAFLRLVDGNTFTYTPIPGKGKAATLEAAVTSAINNALGNFR